MGFLVPTTDGGVIELDNLGGVDTAPPLNVVHFCDPADAWFDREVCPEPCGMMHYRCRVCGAAVDGCEFEGSGNAVVPVAAESGDLWNTEIEALRGNMFAINASSGSVEDRIGRLLALLPVMFQVVEEARSTIARLRDEVEVLDGARLTP